MSPGPLSRLVVLAVVLTVPACAPAPPVVEDDDPTADIEALDELLVDFLSNAHLASAHERFWANDLVYTSSDGTRTYKPDILAGFDGTEADAEPGPRYSADQVDTRLFGTTAVVAFRLVIEPPPGVDEPTRYNLNTGTFLKRNGEWRAVAWQSTRAAETSAP